MLGKDEIESRFGFHKATIEGPDATAEKHAMLRRHFKAFANTLDDLIDDSREKALMWTALEEASMWSHKAIAKNAPILVEGETSISKTRQDKAEQKEAEVRGVLSWITRLKDEGLSNEEIAKRLNLTENTVRKMLTIDRGPVFTD